MKKILGLDVCKDRCVGYLHRSCDRYDLRSYHHLNTLDYHVFPANREGLDKLQLLDFDVAVLEPTGVKYALWFLRTLKLLGKEVYFVGHSQLKAHRVALGIKDKNDQFDAFALADYYLQFQGKREKFVFFVEDLTFTLRDRVHQIGSISRLSTAAQNQLKQNLASEFPEQAKFRSRREVLSGRSPLFLRWLSGETKSKNYDKKLSESVGFGVSDSSRFLASQICNLELREYQIELEIEEILSKDCFIPYRKAFEPFHFGLKIEAYLLAYIYPFEQFLYKGKPEILHYVSSRESDLIKAGKKKQSNKGKPTKKNLSLRRFHKTCGVAPRQISSGDRDAKFIIDGSSLIRSSLWLYCTIVCELNRTTNNTRYQLEKKMINEGKLAEYSPIIKIYSHFHDNSKSGKHRKSRLSATSTYIVTLLFRELVKTICY